MKLIIVGQFFFYGFLWASPLLEYSSMLQSSMQTIKPHNVELFNRFKKEIADSHTAVKKRLLDLSMQKTMNIDAQTKSYLKEHKEVQTAVVAKAQKTLDAHDRALLQETVMKQQSFYDDLEKYWEILAQFWQKYALSFLQTQENSTNPFKSKHAVLYEGDKLSADEKKFLMKRELSIKTGIKKFFNREVIMLSRIGYAAPGGGYRAMILTSGYLAGLEDLGLLDATSYISALSGSTWFLMPWIFFNGSVRNYQNGLLNKIKNNMFNPATALFSSVDYISPDYLSALVAALWPKFLFNQQISSVDIYGSLLSYVLFSKDQSSKHITDQWDFVKEGRVPFPLYNAVSTLSSESDNQIYYWNEFNPLEVRNISLKVAIPAYAFGSEFDDRKSKEIAPLQSLGYLLGTFGSAYLVDLIDVKKIYSALQKESENKGPELAAEYLIAATIVNLINVLPTSIYTYRVYPSFINNFCKNAKSKNISLALKNADTLMYVDGGIVCNIPALPLMRKARSLQVIIIGDTSGDNPKLDQIPWELNRLFKQVRHEFGYEYNLVGEATPTIRFYKDSVHSDAPNIIYVNFVKDDALVNKGLQDPELKKIIDRGNLTKFDFNCVASYPGSYCNFLFFDYTEQQFQQLSAIAEFNIKANKQLIQQFLDK